jgi:uncharacterized protein
MRPEHFEYISSEQIISNLVLLKNLCFEVTDACNLACDYCVYRDLYGDHDERHGKMMEFQQAKAVIDYLANYWANEITGRLEDRLTISFYGGEPLLNMTLIKDVIQYLKKTNLNRQIIYNMTTNAMLLDKHIDYLVENDFSLLVSLDGDLKGNGHRRQHNGSSSFQQVFNNLKYAMRKYPDYFAKRVRFNVVLHDLNDVDTSIKFIHSEFGSIPNISEINPRGLKKESVQLFRSLYKDIDNSINCSNNTVGIQNSMGFSYPDTARLIHYLQNESGNYYSGYLSLLAGLTGTRPQPTPGTCTPFAKKLFVTVNGKILQCERIGQEFSLGIADKEGVHLNPAAVAEEFNHRLGRISKTCMRCENIVSCKKCFYYLDNVDSERPSCPAFEWKTARQIEEENARHYLKKNPSLLEQIKKEYYIQ